MSIKKASETVVKQCLCIQPAEEVLIIVDEKTKGIGEALQAACLDVGAEAVLAEITERELNGEEPPHIIAAAMKKAQVVLAPTSKSLSHTRARRQATAAGARIATMPGITEEMMIRTLTGSYQQIADLTNRLTDILTTGSRAQITAPNGTEIEMSIAHRPGCADTGLLCTAGQFGNLPAGEAFIAPREGSGNGVVVFDGAIAGINQLDKPVEVTVENGSITNISGGRAARDFRDMIEAAGEASAKNLAELGIGTNKNANLSGGLLEVEKVYGTVHLAFGDNKSFGGLVESPLHIDGVIIDPTLVIDGKTIISQGEHLV